jgi:hypothetical protein
LLVHRNIPYPVQPHYIERACIGLTGWLGGQLLGRSTTPKNAVLSLPQTTTDILFQRLPVGINWFFWSGYGWFVSMTACKVGDMVKEPHMEDDAMASQEKALFQMSQLIKNCKRQ